MNLKTTYTILAPFYDRFVQPALGHARQKSLERLGDEEGASILLAGIGSGLDIPLLPRNAHYTGIDITPAMLKKAKLLAEQHNLDIKLTEGSVIDLPYDDHAFDIIIMHLILAVVPEPVRTLQEALRTLKPSGRILIMDKFLRPGQIAPLRRMFNPLISRIATSINLVFEEVVAQCPNARVTHDNPVLAGGWFRLIEVQLCH